VQASLCFNATVPGGVFLPKWQEGTNFFIFFEHALHIWYPFSICVMRRCARWALMHHLRCDVAYRVAIYPRQRVVV
jgi:hypothetical protein